jgi:hypothetical protein
MLQRCVALQRNAAALHRSEAKKKKKKAMQEKKTQEEGDNSVAVLLPSPFFCYFSKTK